MPAITLILADIDGTLVPAGTNRISSKLSESVQKLSDSNIRLCLVTGRPYKLTQPIINALAINEPVICDGGARIINPSNEAIIWEKRLSRELTQAVVAIMSPTASRIDYGGEDEASQVWAAIPTTMVGAVVKKLRAIPHLAVHQNPAPSGDTFLCGVHVTHAEADKYHAVQQLLRLEAVAKDHIMAIGDADNDLPLFENAGLKIAVGTTSSRLLALADHAVTSVENDGFTAAINQFVLSEKQKDQF